MNSTTNLYNHINRLCNPATNWKNEHLTIRSLDKLINTNLEKFFSTSDEFGKKEKLEILLNFRDRIIEEFALNVAGEILALAVSGIAHEVFNQGQHSLYKPPEIMDQIAYHILSENLFTLDEIFLKDKDDILNTDKFKQNLDNATLRILDEDKISLNSFGIENASEAVNFIIDHQNQLSIANLSCYSDLDHLLLEKLRLGCPNLKRLDLKFCCNNEFALITSSKFADVLGKMTSLEYLNFSNNSHMFPEDLLLALNKLNSLKHLILDNSLSQLNDANYISLKNLSIAIEQMSHLETLVIPSYRNRNEDEINELVLVLEKLPSFKLILTKDMIMLEKLKEKLKTKVKVDAY